MKKFLLLLIFIALLIGQRSHVVEKVKVYDRTLGVHREEYHWNWNNYVSYCKALVRKAKSLWPKD